MSNPSQMALQVPRRMWCHGLLAAVRTPRALALFCPAKVNWRLAPEQKPKLQHHYRLNELRGWDLLVDDLIKCHCPHITILHHGHNKSCGCNEQVRASSRNSWRRPQVSAACLGFARLRVV